MVRNTPLLCFVFICLLASCSGLNHQTLQQPVTLNITMPEPNRLRFSGKGAAAGMALMSTMGAVGPAIGIAIDEGIGKDLEAQLVAQNYDVESALHKVLQMAIANACCADDNIVVLVERYGFRTWGDAEFADPISPEFKFVVQRNEKPDIKIDYPAKFEGDLPLVPLEEAKVNGTVSKTALQASLLIIAAEVGRVLTGSN